MELSTTSQRSAPSATSLSFVRHGTPAGSGNQPPGVTRSNSPAVSLGLRDRLTSLHESTQAPDGGPGLARQSSWPSGLPGAQRQVPSVGAAHNEASSSVVPQEVGLVSATLGRHNLSVTGSALLSQTPPPQEEQAPPHIVLQVNVAEAPVVVQFQIDRNELNACKDKFVAEGNQLKVWPKQDRTYAKLSAGTSEGCSHHPMFPDDRVFQEEPDPMIRQCQRYEAMFSAYKEVLSTELSPDDHEAVQASLDAFKHEVRSFATARRQELKDCPADNDALKVERTRQEARATRLENLVLHQDNIQALRAKSDSNAKFTQGVLGAAVPQFIASTLSFGYPRNGMEDYVRSGAFGYQPGMHAASILLRGGMTGLVLGAAHYVAGESAKPITFAAIDALGAGRAIQPVSPEIAYPDPPEVVTRNGVPARVGTIELNRQRAEVAEKRAAFTRAQAAHKLGSMGGDLTGYLAFGGAHGVRSTIGQFAASAAMGSLHARSLTSGVGGAVMATRHAWQQLTQKVDGVPTHTVADQRTPVSWGAMGTKLNILSADNRKEFMTRIGGSIETIAMSSAVEAGFGELPLSGIAGKLKEGAVAGLNAGASLMPFFANATASAEAKEANRQQPLENPGVLRTQFDGTVNALRGVVHPGANHIPHADDAGRGVSIENTYQVVRHTAQLIPQIVADAVDGGIRLTHYAMA